MIKKIIHFILKRFGFKLVRIGKENSYYIDAVETVRAAQERNISVCEYVEEMWDQRGCTEYVINQMKSYSCFVPGDRVCEVGPGTGRYLELVIKHVSPAQYDIYEIADDWAKWLAETYSPPVVRQAVDGHSLASTPDVSCSLVHAHGVFVYLSLLHSYQYFSEMIRVCAPGGYVVFDFFSNIRFDLEMIKKWLSKPESYPVVLERDKVVLFFENHGFQLVHEFDNKLGHGYSSYVIFKRGQ